MGTMVKFNKEFNNLFRVSYKRLLYSYLPSQIAFRASETEPYS